MGLETRCAVRVDDTMGRREDTDAMVQLEGDALMVRGPVRITVPRTTITAMTARDGVLTITHTAGTLRLSLGDAAGKWKLKIAEGPRSRAQKLGVKPGMRVTLVDVNDPTIGREIAEAGAVLVDDHLHDASQPIDLLLTEVRSRVDLERIASFALTLRAGAMWVIHPNGVPEVGDTVIFAEADKYGLVSTKVMSFSTGMSAERLSRRR